MTAVSRPVEVVDEAGQGRQRGPYCDLVGGGKLIQGVRDALLVGLFPVGELVAAGLGEGDHRDAPIAGVGYPRGEPGLDEGLDQPADGVRRQPQQVRELAYPCRLVVV